MNERRLALRIPVILLLAASILLFPSCLVVLPDESSVWGQGVSRSDGSASDPASEAEDPVPGAEERFGRQQLDARDGGRDHLVDAYDRLVRGLSAKRERVELDEANPVTLEDIELLLETIQSDWPCFYWLDTHYSYTHADGVVKAVEWRFLTDIRDHDDAFEEGIRSLLDDAHLTTGMTLAEQERALHDALCRRVTYDLDAAHPYSAYGAIVEGRAVCMGYAGAFQVLLDRAGITSFVVNGDAENENGGGSHSWNLVRLEGGYCYTDVTWDDHTSPDDDCEPIYYGYFNRDLSEFSRDHTPDTSFTLPAGSDEWNFYNLFPQAGVEAAFDGNDAELSATVADLLRGNASARLYVRDANPKTVNTEAMSWLKEHAGEIARELGMSGMSYSYGVSCSGREAHLTVSAIRDGERLRSTLQEIAWTGSGSGKTAVITASVAVPHRDRLMVRVYDGSTEFVLSPIESTSDTVRFRTDALQSEMVTVELFVSGADGTYSVPVDRKIYLHE